MENSLIRKPNSIELYAKKYSNAISGIKRGMDKIPKSVTRSDFIQSIFNLNREPLSLYNFYFWIPILDSPRLTLNTPKEDRIRVFKTSRQVAKSTIIGVDNIAESLITDYSTNIIALPTDKQVSKFSVINIKTMNASNVITQEIFYDKNLNIRQVGHKSYSTGARIILANIYASTVAHRGIPGDNVTFDEYQSIPPDNAKIIVAALTRSRYMYRTYSGTPLEEANDLEAKFQKGTRTEWSVKCKMCGHWNVGLGLNNMGKKGLICEHCGRRIYAREGEWIDANPGAEIESWHINELMMPPEYDRTSAWKTLVRSREEDLDNFMNESLGLSIRKGRNPITDRIIAEVCDSKRRFVTAPRDITQQMKRLTFAGIDWAMETSDRGVDKDIKSYTMLTIGSYDSASDKEYIWFTKRYYDFVYENDDDPDVVEKDMAKWINAFGVILVGADYGAGHSRNQRLRKILGPTAQGADRLAEFQYLGNIEDRITYDVNANKFIVNRTWAMDQVVRRFKDKGYNLPKFNGEVSEYADDLKSIYVVNDRFLRKRRYGKKGTDDWMHSFVFRHMARLVGLEMIEFVIKDNNS